MSELEKLKTNIFGSPVIAAGLVVVALGLWQAPAIIEAWRKPMPVPVVPVDPVPNPSTTFATAVKQAYDGDEADTAEIIGNCEARIAILDSDVAIADTKQLGDIWLRAANLAYGESRYKGARFAKLWSVIYQEQVKRGLLAADTDDDGRPDEALPVDRKGWSQLYSEVAGALQ